MPSKDASPTWKDEHRTAVDWTMDDFVRVAGRTLERLGLGDRDTPNERLIRFYAGEGAMTKPARDGREVRYAYRHLVEFLVTRLLLKDGWPLAKIGELVAARDLPALEAMLPDAKPRETEAERAIADIKHSLSLKRAVRPSSLREPAEPYQATFALNAARPAPSAATTMLSVQENLASTKGRLSRILADLAPDHTPAWRETLTLDLTPWCRVTLDADAIAHLPHASDALLGEALTEALREQRLARRTRRQRPSDPDTDGGSRRGP